MTDRFRLFTPGIFEIRGFREVERLPNPAPGDEIRRVIEGGVLRRLLSLHATFTTSAAVGNRIIHLRVEDNDGRALWEFVNGAAIPASTTVRLAALPGIDPQTSAMDGVVFMRSPDFVLMAGERLVTATTGIAAGDAYTNISIVWEVIPLRILEELLTPAGGG